MIGYGLAGQVFHAPLIAANPDLEVRAIVTANPERRQRAQRDFPEARLLATPDQLWNDTSGIGLVVVATPNHLHAPQAIAALGLGLAVVVDKPMALSTVEAGTMLEAAERASGVFAVFQNRRWDSDFLLLRELVEKDRLGGLFRIESVSVRRSTRSPGERRPPPKRGAGCSWTSALTSSTRRCSSSDSRAGCTRRSRRRAPGRSPTTTASSPSSSRAAPGPTSG
jgi:predicted dehydrogenase